jgi:AcrR family transcriptional regulator
LPLGADLAQPRRTRTRSKLLAAAHVIFARDGFHSARLVDITAEAGVAVGTFYNHYDSKEALLSEVLKEVVDDLTDRDVPASGAEADLVDRLEGSIRSYVRGYRRHAPLMALLLQLRPGDGEAFEQKRRIRDFFAARVATSITRWQESGLVYADVDPGLTGSALADMIDRFMYDWTLYETDLDEDRAVRVLVSIYTRALGLDHSVRGERALKRAAPSRRRRV